MATLDVENGRRIYFEHHPGEARATVLVHGWGVNSRCWDMTVAALLAAGHEVVTYDQRCCGRSDRDFHQLGVDAGTADLLALLEATGVGDPVLVGWSFGSIACTTAAAEAGAGIGGLCLVCPTTPRFTEADDFPYGAGPQEVTETLRGLRESRPDFLHAVAERIGNADLGPNTVEWIWQQFMAASPRADHSLAELSEVDQRHLLPTIAIPSLVVSGSADPVVDPGVHRYCASLLPASRLIEFAEAGHAPFLDDRARFNEALLTFLADPAAAVAGSEEAIDPLSFFA